MDKYEKLAKNSAIFAISNFADKVLKILIVPLYTYVLTTEEYGEIDLITNLISLIVPIITLYIQDATLRFIIDKQYNSSDIISTSLKVVTIGNLVLLLSIPILIIVGKINQYYIWMYAIIITQGISLVLEQYARGIGRVKEFAINGIIKTIITLGLNIVLLVVLKIGVSGYFISILVSYIGSILYLLLTTKVYKEIVFKSNNKKLLKEMLAFSIPLLPSILAWWIMNVSDRYMILYYLGASQNGIYAIASKIPTVLSTISTIFFQAWQLSAFEEANSKERDEFYNKIFNIFSIMMFCSVSIILVFLKPIIKIVIESSYYESWQYTPFLLLGVAFSNFSVFIGTNYSVQKKTKGAFTSTIISTVINIVANLALIPLIGVNGAAIATCISYVVLFFVRKRDTREYIKIELNIKKWFSIILLLLLQIAIYYNIQSNIQYVMQFTIFIIICLINYKEVMIMIDKIKERYLR